MSFPQPSSPQQNLSPRPAPVADPRLQPTPDYGTLDPVSDFPKSGESAELSAKKNRLMLVAVSLGISMALLVASLGSVQAGRSRWAGFRSSSAPVTATFSDDALHIDQLKPQNQAEALLELAVAHSDRAVDQISSRVDGWQGKLNWDPRIATLTTAALNSSDTRVRESGIEVELAAYGLAKNSESFDYLVKIAESSNHAHKVWALWALGLMGNRGIDPERAVQVLSTHLQDPEADSRRWAVDGLALVGGDDTVSILLNAMHDDTSPVVREEAACAIAQSGMFSHQQRMSAVPQLLNDTEDSSLDTQTHAWAFQALGDITGQHLPNDSVAWRNWYEKRD
jgi:hypothetical protein